MEEEGGGGPLVHLKFQKALLLKLKNVIFIMVWGHILMWE